MPLNTIHENKILTTISGWSVCRTIPILILFLGETAAENSLDQDQERLNVGLDLVPNCLTLMVFLIFFLKLVLKEIMKQRGRVVG